MGTVRWGIIGCGDVTEVKSGPALQKAVGSELTAVMRRNSTLAQDYAKRHGVPKWTDNAQELINDLDIDAIYIATPPAFHKEYTIQSAQAGKPVYVEKPMALNFAECQAMITACQTANVPLFVAYYRRMLPKFLKIKSLIDANAIGDIRFVNITLTQPASADVQSGEKRPWRVVPDIAGGGLFVDLASHMLDILDYVLGPIQTATGFATNQAGYYQAEDIVTSTFMFESGVHGVGSWCFTGFEQQDRTEIVGSEGKLTFSTFDDAPIELSTSAGTESFSFTSPPHIQQPLIQTVVDAINETGTCPSTGQSAARTSRVMDQMLGEM